MLTIKILSISILSLLLTFFLPWYTIAIVSFLIGILFSNKPGSNFLAGFFGVGIFWLIYTLVLDIRNDHILSARVAMLFSESLKTTINGPLLIVITTFIGALVGGLSSLAGGLIMDDGSRARLRKAIKNGRYSLKI
jgi:hypothetical protein